MRYQMFESQKINTSTKVALYGAGHIAEKTLKQFNHIELFRVFDSSENLHGTQQFGTVISPPEVKNLKQVDLFIITSTAIDEISRFLIAAGIDPNIIYVSPLLKDRVAIAALEELECDIFFSSGSVYNPFSGRGGGLYTLSVRRGENELKKIYDGSVYGTRMIDETIFFVDTNNGVMSVDRTGGVNLVFKLPHSVRAHGLCYDANRELFSVTCSYRDSVLFLDKTGEVREEIFVSNKFNTFGTAQHHVNDHALIGDYLYISMFSISGNWKSEFYDGGIMQVNLQDPTDRAVLCNSLSMPHNIEFFENELYVLDSLKGNLCIGSDREVGHFPGFTRGLDKSGNLIALGQSKNRNHSKLLGMSNNISIDCGIVFFDPDTKFSRQVILPNDIGEVHSIRFENRTM